MVDNKMEQDLNRKLIHIHNRKVTVQETNPFSILPIQSMLQSSDNTTKVDTAKNENNVQTDNRNKEKAREGFNQSDSFVKFVVGWGGVENIPNLGLLLYLELF